MHEDAKYHGKLRTKFDRMAISVHVLNAVCRRWNADRGNPDFNLSGDWAADFAAPGTIPKEAFEFTYIFADHCEQVWATLDIGRAGHTLPAEVDPAMPTQARPAAQAVPAGNAALGGGLGDGDNTSSAEQLASLAGSMKGKDSIAKEELVANLKASPQAVAGLLRKLPIEGITVNLVRDIMMAVLRTPGAWFYWSTNDTVKRAMHRMTRTLCQDLTLCAVFYACLGLQALKLGSVERSVATAGGGRPVWFFAKRPVSDPMRGVLACLGITRDSTPSLAAYAAAVAADASKPVRAPDMDWDLALPFGLQEELAELLEWPVEDLRQAAAAPAAAAAAAAAAAPAPLAGAPQQEAAEEVDEQPAVPALGPQEPAVRADGGAASENNADGIEEDFGGFGA